MLDVAINVLTSDAFTNILSIFLGAFLGVPAGIWLNHAIGTRAAKCKRDQLLDALRGAVDTNVKLIGLIRDWTRDKSGTPFFTVDLTLLESTAAVKYDLLNDIELCKKLDHFRFELTHLSRKVDILLRLEFDASIRLSASSSQGGIYKELRARLVGPINSHIEQIQKTTEELKEKLQ